VATAALRRCIEPIVVIIQREAAHLAVLRLCGADQQSRELGDPLPRRRAERIEINSAAEIEKRAQELRIRDEDRIPSEAPSCICCEEMHRWNRLRER